MSMRATIYEGNVDALKMKGESLSFFFRVDGSASEQSQSRKLGIFAAFGTSLGSSTQTNVAMVGSKPRSKATWYSAANDNFPATIGFTGAGR